MAACATCGTTILFGGKSDGARRFCSDKCLAGGTLLQAADAVPDAIVNARVWEIYNGRCPKCSGPGPVNVHPSYRVWSGLIVTSYTTRSNLCCRSCATRARLQDAGFSLALGWWGFPWGLIWTPVQIFRNVAAILRAEESGPSPQLANAVRLQLAVNGAAQGASPVPLAPR
jgi:hypothetical protein